MVSLIFVSRMWAATQALMIKRGEKVRLTARAAAAFNNKRRHRSIWTGRRGVVLRITKNKADAVVLWDGRISREYVPIHAIEAEPADLE